jgi:transposase
MAFVRKIKKGNSTYLALVESYRKGGKVKQRVKEYLGKEVDGKPEKKVRTSSIGVESVKRYGDVLCVDKISKDLGLKDLVQKEVLLLAYSHLLDEVSINNLEEWVKQTEILGTLGMESVSVKKIYESLSELSRKDFETIEEKMYVHFSKHEPGKDTVVVDVTDTYFEGRNGSGSRKRRGKDGKYKNLVQICLAASLKNGFPVMHKVYEGNISNIRIFQDMTAELKHRGFNSVIVDRGMHSRENIQRMDELDMRTVLGAKKTGEIKKGLLSGLKRGELYCNDSRIVLKNTTVYAKSFPYLKGKLIVVYNPFLEAQKIEHHYEKGGSDLEAKHLGYSCIYHNTEMNTSDVVKQYFEKDIIERSFKQLKGALNLRPIRVWLKNHVKGHIRVCYLAYAILTMLGHRIKDLDISPVNALQKLKTSYVVHLKNKENNQTWTAKVNLEKIQDNILKKTGVVYKT